MTSPDTNRNNSISGTISVCMKKILARWKAPGERLRLLRWSAGFFSVIMLLQLLIGIQYIAAYQFPASPLAFVYTIAAFLSHLPSFTLIFWIALIIPLILIAPFRKVIIPFCIIAASMALCAELLDAQLFTTRRFHLGMLTIRILGWKTWGFGIFYLVMFMVFMSFMAKQVWNHFVMKKKRLLLGYTLPVVLVSLLFTHVTHMWADATGYVEITRFTTTLPLFYPSTSKRFMVRHGFADMSARRNLPKDLARGGDNLFYPKKKLTFADTDTSLNVLIVTVDAMRADMMNEHNLPRCFSRFKEKGTLFTNHYSGGNSTKMGAFSLFYGIPSSYQPYIESHRISPVLINRILEKKYMVGIFTSHELYAPANLDVTAFVHIPDLRLKTNIPDPQESYRKDSAVTEEWKSWLHEKPENEPFFGFLFYDALCATKTPPGYAHHLPDLKGLRDIQKKFEIYKVNLLYLDSLVDAVFTDLDTMGYFNNTVVLFTSDHGEEYDDNGLGFTGHGSSFSEWQIRTPMAVFRPNKSPGTITTRTSHYDITATLMKEVFKVENPVSEFCSGKNLFSGESWDWLLVGSYFNYAIVEPGMVTIQFPGGYYEIRDSRYQIVQKPKISSNIAAALDEVGRFYRK